MPKKFGVNYVEITNGMLAGAKEIALHLAEVKIVSAFEGKKGLIVAAKGVNKSVLRKIAKSLEE